VGCHVADRHGLGGGDKVVELAPEARFAGLVGVPHFPTVLPGEGDLVRRVVQGDPVASDLGLAQGDAIEEGRREDHGRAAAQGRLGGDGGGLEAIHHLTAAQQLGQGFMAFGPAVGDQGRFGRQLGYWARAA
jgi:hypothetical protein